MFHCSAHGAQALEARAFQGLVWGADHQGVQRIHLPLLLHSVLAHPGESHDGRKVKEESTLVIVLQSIATTRIDLRRWYKRTRNDRNLQEAEQD